MSSATISSLIFILQTLGSLYILVCLLRLILPLTRADFSNPFCHSIARATEPGIKPLRYIFPPIKGFSTAALAWAFLVQMLLLVVIVSLKGINVWQAFSSIWIIAISELLDRLLDLYLYALIIIAVASFFAPHSGHPLLQLVHCIVEPFLRPIRERIPPMGGFDFSILVAFIIIHVLRIFLVSLTGI